MILRSQTMCLSTHDSHSLKRFHKSHSQMTLGQLLRELRRNWPGSWPGTGFVQKLLVGAMHSDFAITNTMCLSTHDSHSLKCFHKSHSQITLGQLLGQLLRSWPGSWPGTSFVHKLLVGKKHSDFAITNTMCLSTHDSFSLTRLQKSHSQMALGQLLG